MQPTKLDPHDADRKLTFQAIDARHGINQKRELLPFTLLILDDAKIQATKGQSILRGTRSVTAPNAIHSLPRRPEPEQGVERRIIIERSA